MFVVVAEGIGAAVVGSAVVSSRRRRESLYNLAMSTKQKNASIKYSLMRAVIVEPVAAATVFAGRASMLQVPGRRGGEKATRRGPCRHFLSDKII